MVGLDMLNLLKPFLNMITNVERLLGFFSGTETAENPYGLSGRVQDDAVIVDSSILLSGLFGSIFTAINDLNVRVIGFEG